MLLKCSAIECDIKVRFYFTGACLYISSTIFRLGTYECRTLKQVLPNIVLPIVPLISCHRVYNLDCLSNIIIS